MSEGNWFTRWLQRSGRMRAIPDRDGIGDYMHRYYLLFNEKTKDRAKRSLFNLFLHNIRLSDERAFHDHPWWSIILILKGGYWEHTPKGMLWRAPWSLRFMGAESLHYIILDESAGPVWTLFFHGPRKRTWGFIDPTTKIWTKWDEWIAGRRNPAAAMA